MNMVVPGELHGRADRVPWPGYWTRLRQLEEPTGVGVVRRGNSLGIRREARQHN